ncbi:hypothetical protein NP233_g11425 [Leucocoprinus birnbaumii]|uniref:Nephrocystin 3-like N-terminal domain-containing protein n=1 Tax=Leucocoprinus birnbaumii TaxID=56174 RepID=A0AAD5YNZ6_9AGAR|nr:hypothetical protein NP233_g11425 [Leucocoprinus birnbaumii]
MAISGLKTILEHSMPDAFHDSAARYPPPKCHFGTRKDYINQITDWALGQSEHKEHVLWLRGPFGIGKSAVAQSFAEVIKRLDRLAATLFFSRSNADRDDPLRVITSLAYQIATICDSFANIIDARIRKDPSLTTKSLSTQFEELLVTPLSQIDSETRDSLEGRVIIIDGLDECRGTPEQLELIRIIALSAQNRTTPFRWFVTSRPEDPIIRTMNSTSISSVVYRIELPVSRSIDHEILLFLTDEFTKIRESHGLQATWPTDEVLALLVERGAGLWVYVSTIIRFINDENSFGPEDQLEIVMKFIGDVSDKVEPNNPLAEMDCFYTLIMQRIPLNIQTMVRRVVLLHSMGHSSTDITDILSLSVERLRRCCVSIQSVMELQGSSHDRSSPDYLRLHFYHASFIDYLTDPARSREICVRGELLVRWRQELLEWLHFVYAHTTDSSHFVFPAGASLPKDLDGGTHHNGVLDHFWDLCYWPNQPIDIPTAVSISNLPFRKMLSLLSGKELVYINPNDIEQLHKNLPIEFHSKVLRREKCPTPGCTSKKTIYILGHGDTQAIVYMDDEGDLVLHNNQNWGPDKCPCGAQIKRHGQDGKGH